MIDGATTIRARRFALCTGAAASVPPIDGLREADALTNETVFQLTERPQSLSILGAGPIGCELAQAFARLGVKVHLFEMAPRVMAIESERASVLVETALRKLGVEMHLGEGVSSVQRQADGSVVVANGVDSVTTERVLVALGRAPNTRDLNVEAAGIQLDKRGFVQVDAKLRTSNSKVFAAGDCAAQLQFTHHADAQARALVQNALFLPTARVDGLVIPHCTYTSPEVASVGESADSLTSAGTPFDTYTVNFGELDRGRTENDVDGYAEVFTEKGSDRILGASIVGHDAGEQLAPICLLMSNGKGLGAAARTVFAYPTRSEYLKRLADAYNRTRFTPFAQGLVARWFRFIG